MPTPFRHPFALLLQTGTVLLCIAGSILVFMKAGLPVQLRERDGRLFCTAVHDSILAGGLQTGDCIRAVNGVPVMINDDVEFLLDGQRIGMPVTVEAERAAAVSAHTVITTAYFSVAYRIIMVLVSGLFLAVGLFVFYRRPDDLAIRIYHLGSLGTALFLSCTSGFYITHPPFLSFVTRSVFFTAYAVVPAIFYHFTLLFPRRSEHSAWIIRGAYVVAFFLAAGSVISMLDAMAERSLDLFRTHYEWLTAARLFLVAAVGAGCWNIVRTYMQATDEAERRRLRWVLWGLFVGFFPFAFLWSLPHSIVHYGLVPEEVLLLAAGVIPLSIGISIVRYHIMDIDLIFQRSVVYGTVMGLLLTLYIGLIASVAALVTTTTQNVSILIAGGSAIVVALLFQPLRNAIQEIVDRRFFRIRYDYRRAQREFLEELKQRISVPALAHLLVERASALIPVERLAFVTMQQPGEFLQLLAHENFDVLATHKIRFQREHLQTDLRLPVALSNHIEPGVAYEQADQGIFQRWGIVVAFALLSSNARPLGFLVLGSKRSGLAFTSEDIDLLRSMTTGAGREIERIQLQEELLRKQAEAEHLRELNDLKSEFVSYVSHELKTPLTSIKMFAQLLSERRSRLTGKDKEYLRIIEGETDRLDRMVSTILESTRIEEGIKRYVFRESDLVAIARNVLCVMEYQLVKDGFTVSLVLPGSDRGNRTKLAPVRLPFTADSDAVAQAITNLLGNAVKFSEGRKEITVTVGRNAGEVFCRVDDRGRGIAPEALPHLFEKFYRDESHGGRTQGVGLGLSVVKHIMDAHGGTVDVRSTVGQGSSFCLRFPESLPSDHPGETR